MEILICCDKFKGTISAQEVCHSIAIGVASNNPQYHCIEKPLADGGDGSLEVLKSILTLEELTIPTIDPLNRKIEG